MLPCWCYRMPEGGFVKTENGRFSVTKETIKCANAFLFKCAIHKVAVRYIQLLEQTAPSRIHTDEFPNVEVFDIRRMIYSIVVLFHHYRGLPNTATCWLEASQFGEFSSRNLQCTILFMY